MRKTYLRVCLAAVVLAAVPGKAAPDALGEFLAENRCPVADRLQRMFDTGDPAKEMDRYLVISAPIGPQTYVQCVFHDDETMVQCEASSGFFLDAPGAPRSMVLAPDKIAALGRLGFSTDGSADNFKLDVPFPKPPDFGALADLMLKALYVGYDVRVETPLKFNAPMAPGAPACEPVG